LYCGHRWLGWRSFVRPVLPLGRRCDDGRDRTLFLVPAGIAFAVVGAITWNLKAAIRDKPRYWEVRELEAEMPYMASVGRGVDP
jgi:hypothetical protein